MITTSSFPLVIPIKKMPNDNNLYTNGNADLDHRRSSHSVIDDTGRTALRMCSRLTSGSIGFTRVCTYNYARTRSAIPRCIACVRSSATGARKSTRRAQQREACAGKQGIRAPAAQHAQRAPRADPSTGRTRQRPGIWMDASTNLSMDMDESRTDRWIVRSISHTLTRH